jgi:C4-dicarboxylate-binding protein DctP
VKASGRSTVYALTAEEQAVWQQALLPVHREMEGRIGKPLVDAAYRKAAALGYKLAR